jgi:S-DNA-T family DNA segregation ATPase FtsK/SpoIIIE
LIRGYFEWSFYYPLASAGHIFSDWRGNLREKRKKLKLERTRKKEEKERLKKEREKEQVEVSSIEKDETIEKSGSVSHEELLESEESKTVGEGLHFKGEFKDQEEIDFEITEKVTEREGDYDKTIRKTSPRREYLFPSIDLLDAPPEISFEVSRDELKENADLLEKTLKDFGIEGRVVHVAPGPVITRYEIEPATGVRVSRIVSLSDDIARVLRAMRVRIIAPIPGKAAVGVEIPNRHMEMVHLKSIINSKKFLDAKSKLTVAVGKTTSGGIYITDLTKMPHLLIAGATGSGKSVCLNTIILSILYRARPDEVRLIMIDPKKLELSMYKALEGYHLITSEDLDEYVITKSSNAVLALRSAEVEMEKRYTLLADAVVRNIEEYNKKAEKSHGKVKALPYIVIIIDELADLILTAAREIEEPVARLAQMARAVGIHLIVATQRPSVDIITGPIKANFPCRMAFQVAQKTDSRTILDRNGAEKLLGRGDMLFLPPGQPEPVRLHNAFVSIEEIERVLEHIKNQPKPEEWELPSVMELQEEGEGEEIIGERDPLFEEAAHLVITHQQASVSLIQRRLRVGYSRAGRIIDELERAGIIGGFEGSKARDVLVDESYLENLKKPNNQRKE